MQHRRVGHTDDFGWKAVNWNMGSFDRRERAVLYLGQATERQPGYQCYRPLDERNLEISGGTIKEAIEVREKQIVYHPAVGLHGTPPVATEIPTLN